MKESNQRVWIDRPLDHAGEQSAQGPRPLSVYLSKSEKMAETEGETSNPEPDLTAIFKTLTDWEHQLKALDEAAPIEWDEPSP